MCEPGHLLEVLHMILMGSRLGTTVLGNRALKGVGGGGVSPQSCDIQGRGGFCWDRFFVASYFEVLTAAGTTSSVEEILAIAL